MISYLQGKVFERNNGYITLLNNNVGFEIFILENDANIATKAPIIKYPINPASKKTEINKNIKETNFTLGSNL